MAKKDNDNFDFEVEGEGKAKAGLNLDFIKNLTKQQKGIILAALVGIILVIAIIVVVVIVGAGNGGNTPGGNTNPGGDNSQVGGGSGSGGNQSTEISGAISDLQISSFPNKTEYYVDETADYTGLKLYYRDASGASRNIYYTDDPDAFTITGFDSSTPTDKQEITVSYGEFSDTFTIKILARSLTQSGLVSIKVDPLPNTTYQVGDSFDPMGGYIVCEYEDGTTTTVKLSMKHISGFDATIAYTPGEHQIKVKYADDHGGYAETYITVTITE